MPGEVKDVQKALELALASIDKEFGKGSVFFGDTMPMDVDVIPTGCFELDMKLGVGGLPRGRIIEIFGAEGLGKTLIALSLVAQFQKQAKERNTGEKAAFVDAECAMDPTWASFLGVDLDDLIITQPESGETALEITERLARSGAVGLIIVDSVAALTPKAELEGSMEDNHIGLQARMMAQALRKITNPIEKNNVCMVFLNQIRDKIGYMQSGTTSPGGRALKFAASVRIELKKTKSLTDPSTGESTGSHIKAIILKNKVFRPGKSAEYDVLHGIGFNNGEQIIGWGVKYGLVNKSGNWYAKIDDNKNFANGIRAAAEYLEENPKFKEELVSNIMKCHEATR